MQEINAWLRSGKDFETGKVLYIKYGKNSFFKSLLNTQGATPYNIKKLGADLKDLAPAPPATTTDAPPIPIVATVPPPANVHEGENTEAPAPSNTSEYPKYLQVKQQIQTFYRQIERNRTELDLQTNPRVLHLTAKQVLSLHGKLTDCWKLIDYYDEHGCFPLVKPTVEEVRAKRDSTEEIQMLRQSTSKAKTRLKNPNCRDVEATKELIKRNNDRIIQLGGKVKS
jgi:hypothetical protein